MKLIGKLKDNVAKAETKEEAKQLIENAGMLLDEEELEQVSGGINGTYRVFCSLAYQEVDEGRPFIPPVVPVETNK